TQERAAVPTSPDLGVSLELFPKNPPLKHVWYAEPTARAACALILGSNHRARRYQRGCWGNTLSPSLEVSAEQRSKWAGMEEITKCSQPHRKPDGPERCMIKGSEVTDFSGKVHFSSTLKQDRAERAWCLACRNQTGGARTFAHLQEGPTAKKK
ncbi:hypothetical protein JOQ06_020697, partial [Pogonophryne albipinna]